MAFTSVLRSLAVTGALLLGLASVAHTQAGPPIAAAADLVVKDHAAAASRQFGERLEILMGRARTAVKHVSD